MFLFIKNRNLCFAVLNGKSKPSVQYYYHNSKHIYAYKHKLLE